MRTTRAVELHRTASELSSTREDDKDDDDEDDDARSTEAEYGSETDRDIEDETLLKNFDNLEIGDEAAGDPEEAVPDFEGVDIGAAIIGAAHLLPADRARRLRDLILAAGDFDQRASEDFSDYILAGSSPFGRAPVVQHNPDENRAGAEERSVPHADNRFDADSQEDDASDANV